MVRHLRVGEPARQLRRARAATPAHRHGHLRSGRRLALHNRDRYAASVDGPTGTPRFVLRSCISRSRPAPGTPAPGGGGGFEAVGPTPWTVLDEDALFEVLDKDDEDEVEAARAGAEGPIKVKRTRATIRISPNNIIIANGLRGDVFKSSAESCQGWYYGTITRQGTGAKHTGWVQGPGLTRSPKSTKSNCSRAFPYTTRIGFINAPFHSITFRTSKRKWTKTGSASQAYLTPGCTLYMNYDAAHGAADPVTGATERLVFKNGDASAKNGIIGYRYTSPDGKYALVSVKSGFKKGKRDIGLWAYASRSCVVPLSARGKSKANRIYFTEIRICDGVRPTEAAKRMNRAPRSKRIRQVKPCRLPNGKSKPGKNVADSLANGWRVGRLRTPR